jgi:processive 1,2-diacylglycerol beta-glucosyltransferase
MLRRLQPHSIAQKRVLFLSASAGAGHVRAAHALLAYARQAEPGIDAVHLDALDLVKPHLRKTYSRLYLSLVRRAPSLWSQLYRLTNEARPAGWPNRVRRRVEAHASQGLIREIAAQSPDVIVCAHFLPAELLSAQAAAGQLDCPVWVQVTDFDLHRMWVHPNLSGYLAPNEEVAFRMRGHGIAAESIHVTGIPIMPAFAQRHDRDVCAREIGLDPANFTLLLMGGGAGVGGLCAIAEQLLELSSTLQLIVVAGKNEAELAGLAYGRRSACRAARLSGTAGASRDRCCRCCTGVTGWSHSAIKVAATQLSFL